MERKKMTKALIGESLKVLMRNHPFEKITIKMITDEAGVIRPTFYNYFCDKYEVVVLFTGKPLRLQVRMPSRTLSGILCIIFSCQR